MRIGEILEVQQEDIYRRLVCYGKKKKKKDNKDLSFDECLKLMQHRSYKRVRGALRQMG